MLKAGHLTRPGWMTSCESCLRAACVHDRAATERMTSSKGARVFTPSVVRRLEHVSRHLGTNAADAWITSWTVDGPQSHPRTCAMYPGHLMHSTTGLYSRWENIWHIPLAQAAGEPFIDSECTAQAEPDSRRNTVLASNQPPDCIRSSQLTQGQLQRAARGQH